MAMAGRDSGNIIAIFSHALHLPRQCPAILGLQPAIQADAYVNGLINYEEFVNATVHMNMMDREEHLYTTFQFFDKDCSGYITRDEIEQALKEKGMYDAKEIKEIIS
ncbi:calcium-dependent protein kinase 17-like [Hordeum vulgare]|nr:calcium-dependent protein kinase 17-like [Hordeum vulgare]